MADLENWMKHLPERLLRQPLMHLIIPGSHDSGAYRLNKHGPIANDVPQWMCKLAWVPHVKHIVHNWSLTQRWDIEEQLRGGIRYLDLRVSRPDGAVDEMLIVHGLYGICILELFATVVSFINSHPEEAIIVDINHFYNFDRQTHQRLIRHIRLQFGASLCPRADPRTLTLKQMRERGHKIVLIYQSGDAFRELPQTLWTEQHIRSPWANTDDLQHLIRFLESHLHLRRHRQQSGFFITQGVRTLDVSDTVKVAKHLGSSLLADLGDQTTAHIVKWLHRRGKAFRTDLNIIFSDAVDQADFCRAVVGLNFVHSELEM